VNRHLLSVAAPALMVIAIIFAVSASSQSFRTNSGMVADAMPSSSPISAGISASLDLGTFEQVRDGKTIILAPSSDMPATAIMHVGYIPANVTVKFTVDAMRTHSLIVETPCDNLRRRIAGGSTVISLRDHHGGRVFAMQRAATDSWQPMRIAYRTTEVEDVDFTMTSYSVFHHDAYQRFMGASCQPARLDFPSAGLFGAASYEVLGWPKNNGSWSVPASR
jgi:hypothetical protein